MLRAPCLKDREETTRATISGTNNFEGMSADRVIEVEVDVATLDEVLDELRCRSGTIRLLKVDVEGHELAVFEGAKNVLQRDRPLVMAELEQRHGTSVGTINELFRQLGYSMFYTENGWLIPCREDLAISAESPRDRAHVKPCQSNINFVFMPD